MGALLARSPRARIWPFGIRAPGRDERATLRSHRSLGYRVRVQNAERPGIEELSDDEILACCRASDGVLHTSLVLARE